MRNRARRGKCAIVRGPFFRIDPSTIWDKVLLVTFEFGGNFLLYGIVGAVIGLWFGQHHFSEMGQGNTSSDPYLRHQAINARLPHAKRLASGPSESAHPTLPASELMDRDYFRHRSFDESLSESLLFESRTHVTC